MHSELFKDIQITLFVLHMPNDTYFRSMGVMGSNCSMETFLSCTALSAASSCKTKRITMFSLDVCHQKNSYRSLPLLDVQGQSWVWWLVWPIRFRQIQPIWWSRSTIQVENTINSFIRLYYTCRALWIVFGFSLVLRCFTCQQFFLFVLHCFFVDWLVIRYMLV